MKFLVFVIFAFLIFTNYTFAQKAEKNCFEVKHLDFFGLDKIDEIDWSVEEINDLLKTDYSVKYDDTRFLIPILVRYLKDFHPVCNKSIDTERFDKLTTLYFKVRIKDISPIKNKSVEEKLNFIRDDFYVLVQDVQSLPRMTYGWDDGPLYGEIPKSVSKSKPLEKITANFGELSISESNNKILLVATDKQNKIIWSRVIKGANPDRYLRNLKFEKDAMEKTSLATIFHFYSEGERLNLYLKPNGEFMYYYHSW